MEGVDGAEEEMEGLLGSVRAVWVDKVVVSSDR
jgi:hypothetical protein